MGSRSEVAGTLGLSRIVTLHRAASPEEAVPAQPPPSPDPEARPPVFRSAWHEVACILTLAMAPVMNSANQGAMLLALPTISTYYGIEGAELSWTVTSYSLVTGATMLVMARIADIVGRKRTLLVGFTWYALFSLVAGFMRNNIAFDAMRGIQALGGAASPSAAVGIIGVIYPASRRKNKALATFAAGAPVGFTTGVVLAGICTQFIGWQAIVFFFAILYGILAIVLYFIVPSDEPAFVRVERDLRSALNLLRSLDWLGVVLSFVGLTLLIFSISQSGGTTRGWRTPYIIVLLIVSIALIALFVLWETRVKNPLMPMFIWRYPGFGLCMLTVACGWLDFQGVLVYFASLTFQHIRGYSDILTTAAFLPQSLTGITINVVAAFVMDKIPGRVLMSIAMLGFLVAALLWALQPLDITYWAMTFPALAIAVVGADFAYNVGNQFSLSAVPPHLKSTAAGIFNVTTQLASSIGVAISTAIVTSKIGNDIEHQSREVLHRGYQYAYWFAVAVAALGLVASLFLKVGTQGGKGSKDNGELLIEKPAAAVADLERQEDGGTGAVIQIDGDIEPASQAVPESRISHDSEKSRT
ncbi:major facilitator superfamily-domain-containing protein [Limtongia smithiae]|uniref:major facilitator superfamily-domain-containing protein n=1 Tax=Limtongia smithiae TaxID=1125753 RepID=UPI0034CF8EDA